MKSKTAIAYKKIALEIIVMTSNTVLPLDKDNLELM